MSSLFADMLRALCTGFLVSIPIGPVGVITMHRSASYGWRAGIIAILPVFIIDTVAAFLFLLDSPLAFFKHYQFPHWFSILGALLLFMYGIIMYRNAAKPPKEDHIPWQRNFFSSLAITLTNPSAYLGYAAIALILSRYASLPATSRISIAIAYCFGALLWWAMLIVVAAIQRNHTRSKIVMQRVASIIMMLAGVVMVFPPHHILHLIKVLSQHL